MKINDENYIAQLRDPMDIVLFEPHDGSNH